METREAIDQIVIDPGKKNLEPRLAFLVKSRYSEAVIGGREENKSRSLFPTFCVGAGRIFSYIVPDVKQIHTHEKKKRIKMLNHCLFL